MTKQAVLVIVMTGYHGSGSSAHTRLVICRSREYSPEGPELSKSGRNKKTRRAIYPFFSSTIGKMRQGFLKKFRSKNNLYTHL